MKFIPTLTAVALGLLAAMPHGLAVGAELPLNPAVTQETIGQTVCVSGWSRSVRPAYAATNYIKIAKLAALGLTKADWARFELDHIIPIVLGGALIDERNLQLQKWGEASEKDMVEACLRTAVCAGRMSLQTAQQVIWSDWRKAGESCVW